MTLLEALRRAGHDPVPERLAPPATPPSQAEAAPPPAPESRITRLARERKLPPKVSVPQ